jgi:hypothetical protein
MQEKLIELHQQRGRLQERIAAQRQVLSQQLAPLQSALDVSDRTTRLVQDAKDFVQKHPLGIGLAIVAMMVLKPRTVLRWTQRGLFAWRTWRGLHTLVPGFVLNRLRKLF